MHCSTCVGGVEGCCASGGSMLWAFSPTLGAADWVPCVGKSVTLKSIHQWLHTAHPFQSRVRSREQPQL
jgi:hypothetical protein